jgi:hypothetical protein
VLLRQAATIDCLQRDGVSIGGPSAVADSSLFPFGRTDRRYLLAVFLMACSELVVVPPALGFRYATDTFDYHLQLETGLLFFWTLFAVVVCLVRLLIVFRQSRLTPTEAWQPPGSRAADISKRSRYSIRWFDCPGS